MKKISVIIPVYNEKVQYLKRLLDSLNKQTYSNIEIIIVDDGSSNSDTLLFLNSIEQSNCRVFHKENGGLGSARNFGLSKVKGDYVGFIDADDWIDENFYTNLLNSMISNNSDISCGVLVVNGENWDKFPRFVAHSIKNKFKYICNGSVCSKLFKLELFNDIFFPEDGLYYEDNPVLMNLLLKANFVSFEPSSKYYYFENPQSICRSADADKEEKRICDSIKILKLIKQRLEHFAPKTKELVLVTFGKFLFFPLRYGIDENYREQINYIFTKKQINNFFEPDCNFVEKLCSLKNSKDKSHRYLTLFGIKFKFKKTRFFFYR